MSRRTETIRGDYFAGMYASDPDPWGFATSSYEQDKYAATLAALPRERYRSTFEPACSIGVLTQGLSERCDRLVACDPVPAAVETARLRCADRAGVEIRQGTVPSDWPEGRFDLIVLSEFLYFLARADLSALVRCVAGSLEPGGDVVLVHWLGPTDYPLSGDEAAEGFIAEAAGFAGVLSQSRTDAYRIDVLRAGAAR